MRDFLEALGLMLAGISLAAVGIWMMFDGFIEDNTMLFLFGIPFLVAGYACWPFKPEIPKRSPWSY